MVTPTNPGEPRTVPPPPTFFKEDAGNLYTGGGAGYRNPGPTIDRHTNFPTAILLAEGFRYRANSKRLKVTGTNRLFDKDG